MRRTKKQARQAAFILERGELFRDPSKRQPAPQLPVVELPAWLERRGEVIEAEDKASGIDSK